MMEVHIGFWWGNLTDRDNLGDVCTDGNIILKSIFKEWDGETWTRLLWLRIGTGGGHFRMG
jgi:hypothetical protein